VLQLCRYCPGDTRLSRIFGGSSDSFSRFTWRRARGHGKSFTADTLEGLAQGSFYIRELDLVVKAPNGAIASFCTFRIDPVSRATELEPIGTHPDYRRRGLGKALIFEGMRLLKKYDPLNLYIDGAVDNPGANHLYESTGFEKKGTYYFWSKVV
jgi:ribosomal protein S18 acetylase RimI-like enzyme